jgi:hypothetical protein
MVHAALNELPGPYREIIRLRDLNLAGARKSTILLLP